MSMLRRDDVHDGLAEFWKSFIASVPMQSVVPSQVLGVNMVFREQRAGIFYQPSHDGVAARDLSPDTGF